MNAATMTAYRQAADAAGRALDVPFPVPSFLQRNVQAHRRRSKVGRLGGWTRPWRKGIIELSTTLEVGGQRDTTSSLLLLYTL